MAVPTAYFISTKNVPAAFAAMQRGEVPKRFTYEHLKQLGFGSSSDRSIIPVLKAIGFLDNNGVPTDRYRRFKGGGPVAAAAMAEGMRDAYADVFGIDQKAQNLSAGDLKSIFARLSDKGDAVNTKMATTFKELAKVADFTAAADGGAGGDEGEGDEDEERRDEGDGRRQDDADRERAGLVVHHDIHVHLPISTDIAVYDAIFRSLRENLR